MGKRVHYNEPNHAHELTFSCYKRRRYLRSPIYCQFLCDAIQASRTKYSFDVWAYVFMPSHVHLLIYPTLDNYDIAKITESIKQSVSRRVMNHAKEEGGELLENFRTDSKLRPYQFWLAGAGYD